LRTWDPKGNLDEPSVRDGILAHHEVLLRLDAMDLERGAKVAGHRGYFLTNEGVDLNQALISYGLDFLRKKGYKKIMPPFFMNKDQMAKTAQLEQFDEELYKVRVSILPSGIVINLLVGYSIGRREIFDCHFGAANFGFSLR
jgi:seryl-tRNA synthetase